ncbi:MAG: ATP-grasp domain-containing protein [Limisphaerales bacterium]|jgi:biotin carboxylase
MKKLLVIGAGFLQDFVIRKSKSMGYETVAIDADTNAVGFLHADKYSVIDIVNEKACLEFAQKERVDGVLTAATDYGVLTASYISEHMGLPGISYEVAQIIKNKYRVRKCLFDKHVDNTELAYEVNKNTDIELLKDKLKYPVMVKPCDGSGSRGVSRVNEMFHLKTACDLAMSASITHRAEIESFIIGKEYGAESLVLGGKVHVLGIMEKWMTKPPYYAELGHAIPNDLPPAVEKKVKGCVESAIVALGIKSGSVNMDLLITEIGKVYIVDIGARMGGNMIGPCVIPYGTGIDYMAAMIQNAVGDTVNLNPSKRRAVATRLLAFKAGVIRKLPNISMIEKQYGVEIYHHMTVGKSVREYHTNLDGCGYIVAMDDTVEKAVDKADAVLELIKKNIF